MVRWFQRLQRNLFNKNDYCSTQCICWSRTFGSPFKLSQYHLYLCKKFCGFSNDGSCVCLKNRSSQFDPERPHHNTWAFSSIVEHQPDKLKTVERNHYCLPKESSAVVYRVLLGVESRGHECNSHVADQKKHAPLVKRYHNRPINDNSQFKPVMEYQIVNVVVVICSNTLAPKRPVVNRLSEGMWCKSTQLHQSKCLFSSSGKTEPCIDLIT